MNHAETQYADLDIDAEVASVNRLIKRRKPLLKPLPEPAYQAEVPTWDWVQQQVHDLQLCAMGVGAAAVVGILFGTVVFLGTRQW